MKIAYVLRALDALESAPTIVRKAFFKQVGFLGANLKHPSLHAKKYDESATSGKHGVNKDWRFYFVITGDTYVITDVTTLNSLL
jgi:hypothetical protein